MDQIVLFGDSITEFAEGPDGFSAVMRNGMLFTMILTLYASHSELNPTSTFPIVGKFS
jgi:hypothetical protein